MTASSEATPTLESSYGAWIVQNKDVYGIRVLNCSFSAPVRSFYWEDPLNLAVMEAWRSGIVVVSRALKPIETTVNRLTTARRRPVDPVMR